MQIHGIIIVTKKKIITISEVFFFKSLAKGYAVSEHNPTWQIVAQITVRMVLKKNAKKLYCLKGGIRLAPPVATSCGALNSCSHK